LRFDEIRMHVFDGEGEGQGARGEDGRQEA
jgi:hypothetical protein